MLAAGALWAERQSSSYILSGEGFDSGGGAAASATATARVSLGRPVVGASTAAAYVVEHGYLEAPATAPPAGPYAAWALAFFTPAQLADPALGGQAADPDGDGLPNLVEYALGLPPLERHPRPPAARIISQGGNLMLVLEFTRRGEIPAGATLTVEASDGLTGWTDLAAKAGAAVWTGPAAVEELPAPDGGEGTVLVRVTSLQAPGEGARQRFVRLRADAP